MCDFDRINFFQSKSLNCQFFDIEKNRSYVQRRISIRVDTKIIFVYMKSELNSRLFEN